MITHGPRRSHGAAAAGHRLGPAQLTVDDARCRALFASGLQRSDAPGANPTPSRMAANPSRAGPRASALLNIDPPDRLEAAGALVVALAARWFWFCYQQLFGVLLRVRAAP